MNSKTKKITALVVSTVAVIATVIIFLISTPIYSTGETVETTNSVATTTETITTQIMIETTTSTTEITTTTTEETIAVVTTEQTTTFTIETQKPTTETILNITKPVVTTTTTIPVTMEEYTEPIPEPEELTYVKSFTRGTYYAYGGPRNGGSQRQLIDCSIGDETVKGSIASSYLYQNYGYNYNGKRTTVYLEIEGYSQMSGYYYLDDCDAGNSNVIDFFFLYESNCPFKEQGVVQVDCYIVN